jgi:tetratricopeptide (TPR) repeat protein
MIFKTCLPLAVAAAIATAHPSAAPARVRVWESTLSLPTYQEGPPNPNPPFDFFETGRFNYPYTIRDALTNDRRIETWRTLHLENEYLRVTVLPDLGGHLYSCVDKISGQEMFYANRSIKKALIGYRGAWAALGIEFNFPVSHNWMSMSPVDFATTTQDDGSASIWVGNTDRVYGTAWRVQLTLQPGRAVLDQDVTLENPSDVRRRFYWWTNAAVEVGEDSRLIYPTRFMASHGFTSVDPWPVDLEGRDLSVIRNQTGGPVSMFTHGSREPFIGVYHPRTDTGVAHVASPADLPTSKVWSWGVDPDGLSWRDALSDDRSAYVELQAGLFRNQETYAFLEPQESIRFTEHWLPVRGIGPFTRATADAVVRVGRTSAGALDVALNVTRELPGARLRILDGTQPLADEVVDLGPAATLTKSCARLTAPGPYTVELKDASGTVLLRHVEAEYEGPSSDEVSVGPQSAYQFPPARDRSEADAAALGEQQELDGNLLGAASTYRDGLARFPESFVLNRAAGRIAVTLRRNQDAVALLGKALWRTSNDAETHYYLGLAYDGVGEATRAHEQWERAHRFGPLRRAACLQLARLLAREGDARASLVHLEDLLRRAPGDSRIGALHTAVLRMTGDTAAAQRQAASSFTPDPVHTFLRVERAALGVDDLALWHHLGAEPQRVLDVASEYMRIGAFAQALDVLDREYPAVPDLEREPGAVAPKDHVLVAYYRGYCRERLGRTGAADYLRASGLSTDYVFPNRPLTATVLKAALTSNASDSTARFLLGALYLSGGMVQEAVEEWEQVRRAGARFRTLHRNLGYAWFFGLHRPDHAEQVLSEGVAVDSANRDVYAGLDAVMSLLGRPASARVAVLQRYPDLAGAPPAIVQALALASAEAGHFGEAERLFAGRFFPREEGSTDLQRAALEVKLQRARTLADRNDCEHATAALRQMREAPPLAGFTAEGVRSLLAAPRFEIATARIEHRCGARAAARARLAPVQRRARGGSPADIADAYEAATVTGPVDPAAWRAALRSGERGAAALLESGASASGLVILARGRLLRALGRKQEAHEQFQAVFLVPDRGLSHHLAREALR